MYAPYWRTLQTNVREMELGCLFVSSRLLITSVIDLESTHGNSFVLSEPDLAWPETKVSSAGVVHVLLNKNFHFRHGERNSARLIPSMRARNRIFRKSFSTGIDYRRLSDLAIVLATPSTFN